MAVGKNNQTAGSHVMSRDLITLPHLQMYAGVHVLLQRHFVVHRREAGDRDAAKGVKHRRHRQRVTCERPAGTQWR